MHDEHQRAVAGESPRVDVADHRVLERSDAVVDVGPGLAVREAVKEAAEAQALGLLPLLALCNNDGGLRTWKQ